MSQDQDIVGSMTVFQISVFIAFATYLAIMRKRSTPPPVALHLHRPLYPATVPTVAHINPKLARTASKASSTIARMPARAMDSRPPARLHSRPQRTTVCPHSKPPECNARTDAMSRIDTTAMQRGTTVDRCHVPYQNIAHPFVTLNTNTEYRLIFIRHGESTWNRDNRFIGWTDTPLTEKGLMEAKVAGQLVREAGLRFDEVHTSMLSRSVETANIVLNECHQHYLPVHKHWRLNERSYGALVSHNKKDTIAIHGEEQVKLWRRAWHAPPPPMEPETHPYWPGLDPRYDSIKDEIPLAESLKQVGERAGVYWQESIVPSLQAGKTVLVVGHENNLRSLVKRLEGIGEDDIIRLNLPRAVPLCYRLESSPARGLWDPAASTIQPRNRQDGGLDKATGFLRADWLGGDDNVKDILAHDDRYLLTMQAEAEAGHEGMAELLQRVEALSSENYKLKQQLAQTTTPRSNNDY